MENLLVNAFVKVVGHCTYEHTLCEVADFRCRDKTIHLGRDRGGFIITVDCHRLPLLKHLAEAFGESLGSFTYHLPTEHIAHCVLYHLAFLIPIIAGKLREVLKAQTHGNLVTTGCGNEVVKPTEIDGRQLVDNHR